MAGGLVMPAAGQATIAFERASGPRETIYVAHDDGNGVRRLPVKGREPAISPDGTKVAYTEPGRDTLRVLDLGSGAVVASTVGCWQMYAWSPDSTRLACEGDEGGAGELAVIDASTGASRRRAGLLSDWWPGSVTWSPDGRRIAYNVWRKARSQIFVADSHGHGPPKHLLSSAWSPVWGPRKLAVARCMPRLVRPGRESARRCQIWTVNPAGGGALVLTGYRLPRGEADGEPWPAAWTPDGRRIVGAIGGTDHSQVISVDARSGRIRALSPRHGSFSYPIAVSADGRTVLAAHGNGGDPPVRLRTVRISGGPSRIFMRNVRRASVSADWQP